MAFLSDGLLVLERAALSDFEADVWALIVPHGVYGPANQVVVEVRRHGGLLEDLDRWDLGPGESRLLETRGAIAAPQALFVGAPPVREVTYAAISAFTEDAIAALDRLDVDVRHLALVAHGPGFGLDGIEAFLAGVGGLVQGLEDAELSDLERITYVERDARKLEQMGAALQHEIEEEGLPWRLADRSADRWSFELRGPSASARTARVMGSDSDRKKQIFVAMPFDEKLGDVFYFGIQQPVRELGFVCERLDQTAFTGDVLEQIKQKIEAAALVIADLSYGNANVYLEVGYAWGRGKPTVLLVPDGEEVRFDVGGQRYLKYKSIRQLCEDLLRELGGLSEQGVL